MTALEHGLPTIACRAAIEIDNVLLNRLEKFKAVPQLVKTLEGIQSDLDIIDPGDAIVINRAISNTGIVATSLTTTNELKSHANNIRTRLKALFENSIVSDNIKDELKQLRSFCIELSKSAASYTHSFDEMEPRHPFRR